MVIRLYKSANDGTLSKSEFLKELWTRLNTNKIKTAEIENMLKNYYELNPQEKPQETKAQVPIEQEKPKENKDKITLEDIKTKPKY